MGRRDSQVPSSRVRRGGRRGSMTLIGLTASIALATAACGSDDDSDAGEAPATGDETSSSNGADATGGPTLRYGVGTNVQTFDPHEAAVAQEYYLHPVYDTLLHAQEDGSYEAGLAEDWSFVDRHTFEMSLRPDVVFSDGEPVDAEAVVANFERGKQVEASPSALFYDNIESAEAVDELTVRLHLNRPTSSLLSDLSRLPGMMMSPAAMDADPGTEPVGAGGWERDADASNPGEVEVYRARSDYWAPDRVQTDTVEIRQYEADAAVNALLGGQADVIEVGEANRAAIEDAGEQLLTRNGSNVYYVQIMDTDGSLLEPLGDVRVRQALSLGIDRESFNQALQFGLGDPTPGFWTADTPYYDESVESMAYDPDRARSLLAEAGYEDGFDVTVPSFGLLVPVAESLQQMWGELGVDVTIEQVEPGTLASVMRDGTTALTPTLARGFTAESHYQERLSPGGPYDPIGTDRGELPGLAEAAMEAESEDEQVDGWREFYRHAVEEGYIMVIGHQIPTAAASTGVSGAVMLPSDNVPQPYGVSVAG